MVKNVYPQVEKELFSFEQPYKMLGYPSDGGVTGYFSQNMTKSDLKLVQELCGSQNINILNTRAFKQNDTSFIVSVGSIDEGQNRVVHFKNTSFNIEYGEFKAYL